MSTVIRVENISKQYRLGEVGTGTLSHDVNRWWHKVRGKEDPYLMIGESNDRTKKGESDYSWALRDVSFEVKQGEVLGIIGRNGAGKSTLLKILSRVTTPTSGNIKIKGRIASLLEVGTGFHPELTGRENIFLNGAILGMRKAEIASKLDEIIDFSGCERYIDTPVKRYSSGMYVRLAFAVAAHLEPEILIIDEVLAVGDAEFQKKCLGKMKDIAGQGRTVLFVSHNIGAISTLCSSALSLANGTFVRMGPTEEVVSHYLRLIKTPLDDGQLRMETDDTKDAQILGVRILDTEGNPVHSVGHHQDWWIEVECLTRKSMPGLTVAIRLEDHKETRIGTIQKLLPDDEASRPGTRTSRSVFKIAGNQISPRQISIMAAIHLPKVAVFDEVELSGVLEIHDFGSSLSEYSGNETGIVYLRECQ